MPKQQRICLSVGLVHLLSLYSTVKTNMVYLSPQALTKLKITAYNNGAWKDFIYCADDSCFN